MKYILLISLLSFASHSSEESEVIATLWQELGHPPMYKEIKPTHPKTEEKKLPAKKIITPKFKEKIIKRKKELSPGQRKIEEIKARNRKLIQQKKVESHAPKDIYEEYRQGMTNLKKETQRTLTEQKNKISQSRLKWKSSRDKFLKNLSTYKENTFEMESTHNSSHSNSLTLLPKNSALTKGRDYYVVKNAFNVSVKDQGRRPTCSAFAGATAIEILLRQNKSSIEVSEQYIYWSSKPYCQTAPCSKKGSWISYAYDNSIKARSLNIPTSSACPYLKESKPGNETQIPLASGCRTGSVKVESYKKINSSTELLNSLNQDNPVVIGVKLSPNFYTSTGIITYQDSLVSGKMDEHASGHALLLIGHMKLPTKMSSEGKVCYLAVNSWTTGWGAGGYGCITEKWLTKYKVRNPFMALTKIRSL